MGKNRKMVGNTPFTSLHITHCRTTKDYESERAKKWDDITVCVTLCFGLSENTAHIPAFFIPWKKNVNFKNNRVFIYFPKDGPIKIVGNPQKFWLLSFQIEKSVIFSFYKMQTKAGLVILLDIHLWQVTVLMAMSYFKANQ